ncbi:carbohydrate ABC transporter permease [Cohnella zeiphila]|uniref:Carbohydrate ABC transporter permease n=1 Tax=Cohnella zeiphila TaxID=2761120 RepID=A0A7X0SHF0_9BACL|nr:carbohydrate ABC transporter permease [Cohnella zeiphila]MBB6730021.1 carbohydrate ABC transporter permease [Cohnella zeiphila]
MAARPRTNASGRSVFAGTGRGALYLVLIAAAALQVLPLVWLLFFSLKNSQEVFSMPAFALPKRLRWENYENVWSQGNIERYFVNSVWITAASVALTVLLASFVTFALTRMRWKLRPAVLGLFMIGMMIPVHSTLIPLFILFQKLGLIDNQANLILSYTAFNLPITIMILLGFYMALPREIEEAAVMDGCGVNRMFLRIVLPMTGSVMVTAAIINMIYNWNEFIFVNTFISSDKLKTLTVGVQNFVGQYMSDWGAIGATLMISILPILIVFFLLSNRIVEGIAAGSVKG